MRYLIFFFLVGLEFELSFMRYLNISNKYSDKNL
jgi:hypothetical protein